MNQFNRIYRVLWSKTKEQWVVTSELEGAGGKKQSKGVVSIFCVALVAAGMLGAAPSEVNALAGTGGLAPVCTGTSANVASTLTGACTMSAADSLTIANTGVVNGTVTIDATSTAANIDNSGAMHGQAANAIKVSNGATGSSIINQSGATIDASVTTIQGVWNAVTQLSNSGNIKTNSTKTLTASTLKVGYAAVSEIPDLVNSNTGIISGKMTFQGVGHLTSLTVFGIDNPTGGTSQFTNSGVITSEVVNNLVNTTSSLSLRAKAFKSGLLSGASTNSGTISGTVTNNANANASITLSAVGLDGTVTTGAGASFSNSGIISANATNLGKSLGSSSIRLTAIGARVVVQGDFINTSTGTITASVQNAAGATTWVSGEKFRPTGLNLIGLSGVARNDGLISASMNNAGSRSSAFSVMGVLMSSPSGTFTNTGSIITGFTGTVPNNPKFVGFSFSGSPFAPPIGVVNNLGFVGSHVVTKANKLYAVSGIGGLTLNNLAGGMLQGAVLGVQTSGGGGLVVNNAGLIDLPDNGVISTMLNYTQQAGGVLRFEVSSPTSRSTIQATGIVDLSANNTIDIKVDPTAGLAAGNTVTNLISAGSIITAGGVAPKVTDDSAAFDFTAAINVAGTGIDLTVVAAGAADTQIPVITLTGNTNITVSQGSTYSDAGATVLDNVDGVITPTVVNNVNTVTVGAYTVVYNATDAVGNAAVPVIRHVQVVVDTTPPSITLNGNASVSVVQNTTYTDAGATASDNIDGDVSANITTGGTFVNTSTPGTYTITYNVSDAAGNAAATVTRNITVTAAATSGGGTTGGNTVDPYASGTSGSYPCIAPSTGMLPTLLSLSAGIGLIRRRKK